MRKKSLSAVVTLSLLLLAPPAGAQTDTSIYDLHIQQSIDNILLQDRLMLMERLAAQKAAAASRNRTAPRTTGGRGTPSRTPRRTPPAAPGPISGVADSVTTFRPAGTPIAPAALARDLGRNPDERARLERAFSDLLENFRDNARRGGGEVNDVARSATYLIAASYSVYYDSEPLSPQAYAALREQVRQAFAEDPKFQQMSDRDKQRVFESYAIAGGWLDIGQSILKRRGDRQGVERWRQMARANLQNMLGAPPERVRFTPTGVEFR